MGKTWEPNNSSCVTAALNSNTTSVIAVNADHVSRQSNVIAHLRHSIFPVVRPRWRQQWSPTFRLSAGKSALLKNWRHSHWTAYAALNKRQSTLNWCFQRWWRGRITEYALCILCRQKTLTILWIFNRLVFMFQVPTILQSFMNCWFWSSCSEILIIFQLLSMGFEVDAMKSNFHQNLD